MKKLILIIMLSLLSIVIVNQSVSADTVFQSEPAANAGGLWHVEDGNRAYVYMRYTDDGDVRETGNSTNLYEPQYDLSLYTSWTLGNQLLFPQTSLYNDYAKISNPNPEIYDRFVIELMSHIIAYSIEPGSTFVFDQVVNDIEVYMHHPLNEPGYIDGDLPYITLEVDGEEIISTRHLNESTCIENGIEYNPLIVEQTYGVKMYWEQVEVAEEIDPGTSVEIGEDPWIALPETSGSPVNPLGEWGTVTDIEVVNQNISFNIDYLSTTYPVSSFTVEGDLDFINKANDILYYTDPNTGDRILYFNFGETMDSAILAGRTFSDVEVWKGEALWNLTRNEIKVTDVQTVYNYIPEADEDGNVYSYFYMPDVPMDDLISVSAVLAYRYWDDGFLPWNELEPGEIQYKNVAAVRGEITSVNPTWVEDTYTTAYLAGGFTTGVMIAASSVIPVYGWIVPIACFVTAGVLTVGDINEWFAYDVEQITHVIPSASLANEINTYISETSESDQFTVDTDKLYKLHLATLTEGDEVEIMSELSNVTQVVWETDGVIYVLNEENIEDFWFGPGTLEPIDTAGNEDLEIIMWVGVGVAGLYIFSKLKLDKKPGLMILLLAGAAYYLYKIGLI